MAYLSDTIGPERLREPGLSHPRSARRFPLSRRVVVDLVTIADAALIAFGALLTARLHEPHVGVLSMSTSTGLAGILAALIAVSVYRHWDFYDPRKLHALPFKFSALGIGLAFAITVVFGFAPRLASGAPLSLMWYLQWFAVSFAGVLAVRAIARPYLRRQALNGRFDQKIAVYGSGPAALRVRDYLQNGPLGIHFAGTYDDRNPARCTHSDALPIVGNLEALINAVRAGEVDQIIIALPATADRRVAEIARKLESLPTSVQVLTHMVSDLVTPRAKHRVCSLGPIGLLDVKSKPLDDWAPVAKRLEDLVLGSLIAMVALPLCLLIALAIKLDSPGPVLFRQRRRGRNRHEFDVWKFRTMRVMQNGGDVPQAQEHDPRITRLGKFLRRTSLDELPQLINVLRGEMSLVGPRPHALAHDDAWAGQLPHYNGRQQVKPGITGLAQVRGYRGPVDNPLSIRQRIDNDIAYIENWSIWLDLRIMFRTIYAVVDGRNAF